MGRHKGDIDKQPRVVQMRNPLTGSYGINNGQPGRVDMTRYDSVANRCGQWIRSREVFSIEPRDTGMSVGNPCVTNFIFHSEALR